MDILELTIRPSLARPWMLNPGLKVRRICLFFDSMIGYLIIHHLDNISRLTLQTFPEYPPALPCRQ